jgi:rod shape-determining protein MreC
VSAFTVTGNASGVVGPSLLGGSDGALEFRGVPYRDSVPAGTLVLSSGLGGVYPKGIPVGTVAGVIREQAGWERVYRLRPAANPGAAAHVLVLVAPPNADLARAFPSDSAVQAMRLDSIARVRRADSLADAERLAREARAESLAVRRDTATARPTRRPAAPAPPRPVGPTPQAPAPATPGAPKPNPTPALPTPNAPAPSQGPVRPTPVRPAPAPGDSAR